MSVLTILAAWRDEDAADYFSEKVQGYTYIETPGHGYLCLGSDDNGYSDALAIARKSAYSPILDGGLVFLEEDCDMAEFMSLGLNNETLEVKATDLMASMGVNVTRIG